jgi:hypothetical protein
MGAPRGCDGHCQPATARRSPCLSVLAFLLQRAPSRTVRRMSSFFHRHLRAPVYPRRVAPWQGRRERAGRTTVPLRCSSTTSAPTHADQTTDGSAREGISDAGGQSLTAFGFEDAPESRVRERFVDPRPIHNESILCSIATPSRLSRPDERSGDSRRSWAASRLRRAPFGRQQVVASRRIPESPDVAARWARFGTPFPFRSDSKA